MVRKTLMRRVVLFLPSTTKRTVLSRFGMLCLTLLITVQAPTSPRLFIAVERSPDGTKLASVGDEGIVVIYDLVSGDQLYKFSLPVERLVAVTWSPDSQRIAAGGSEPYLYVLCVDNRIRSLCTPGTILASIEAHQPYVFDVDWSPDGRLIASVNQQDEALKLWDANTYRLIDSLIRGDPYKVDWNFDGTKLAVVDYRGFASIVDVSLDRNTLQVVGPRNVAAFSIDWSPVGNQLAIGTGVPQSGQHLGGVYIWDNTQNAIVAQFTEFAEVVTAVSWSPDGRRLAGYASDRNVRVWDVANQQLLMTIPLRSQQSVSNASITWDASGNNIVFGGGEETLPIGVPSQPVVKADGLMRWLHGSLMSSTPASTSRNKCQ